MRFTQRNIFYLRASRNVVLQTFLYVDPRHLKWMNQPLTSEEENTTQESDNDGIVDQEAQTIGDEVWAKALGGLRYNIMPKLHNESDGELLSSTNRKGKVEVHLEPNFQMAYFFREVKGKHAVLLKSKQLSFTKEYMPPPPLPAPSKENTTSRLAERQRVKRELDETDEAGEGEAASVGAKRLRNSAESSNGGVHVKEEIDNEGIDLVNDMENEQQNHAETIDVEDDDDDDKKPRLRVSYSGFKIFRKSLIIVIEPTKRIKQLHPGLFETQIRTERSQLSATPIPELRGPPDPASRTGVLPTNSADDRADSRRANSLGRESRLFRGTPSDYEPTPGPDANEEGKSSGQIRPHYHDGEEDENQSSFVLATQMMEGSIQQRFGNELDDD